MADHHRTLPAGGNCGVSDCASVPVWQSASWIDPVSGSLKQQTVWPFGITKGPTYQVSSLESRLHRMGYKWTQSWQFMGKDHYTLLGRPVEFECGSAPAIFKIRIVLDNFVSVSTPEELRRFADVMQFGTEEEQTAAVDAAGEKGEAARFGR